MKVLYMGTPDFAVPSLSRLIESDYEVCAVITQPDRPKGRGMKLTPPPVKQVALTHDIPVYQPEKLKDGTLLPLLTQYQPDVIVVVAYGRILPQYVLEFPKYGCINVHGSLLPKYRGAAPIQWAVINGEKKSGVCTMYMDVGLDTGDIILRAETPIERHETSENLFNRLSIMGADLLMTTLSRIQDGTAPRVPQDDAQSSYAPMIQKEDACIDWTCDHTTILNLIRGSYSWPIAYTTSGNVKLKVFTAVEGGPTTCKPGTVIRISEDGMQVAAGNRRSIVITLLQFDGGRRMSPADYFRGHDSIINTVLGA